MNNLKWLTIFILLFFWIHPTYSQNLQVELPGTQVLKFQSKTDSQQYILYINLPDNYTKTNKKYPVLYVTDGQWFFASMYVGYGGQHYDGFVPDLITVGITWTDNYDSRRFRDFTPTRMEGVPNTGNAPKFLSVIKNEVIKLIDSVYRTDKNDKALYGTSLGGLFAIYTLFHEPALFNRYIIISPSLWWDNEIVFKYEKDFAQKNRSLNAKIFISSGEYEEKIFKGDAFNRFSNQIKASKYKGLEMESMVIGRMSHSGSGTVGGIIGLQSIYSKPSLMLDTLLLNQYTGLYASGRDTASIIRKGNSIYNRISIGGMVVAEPVLYAETAKTFYAKGLGGSLQFTKDDKGKVSGYDLIQNDTTVVFKKFY